MAAENRVFQAWEAFVHHHQPPASAVRPVVADSWRRSRAAGVDPCHSGLTPMLPADDLAVRRDRCRLLLSASRQALHDLDAMLQGAGLAMAVVDPEGCVLQLGGDHEALVAGQRTGLIPGLVLREEVAGTSATALALRLHVPTEVRGAEHFRRCWHECYAAAVPVFDHERNLVGVLGFSAQLDRGGDHTLPFLAATALSVQNTLQALTAIGRTVLVSRFAAANAAARPGQALVALDAGGRVVKSTPGAAGLLGLSALPDGSPLAAHTAHCPELQRVLASPLPAEGETVARVSGRLCLEVARQGVVHQGEVVGALVALRDAGRVQGDPFARYSMGSLVGRSPKFLAALHLARVAAASDATVLLTGESGTGKELVAQAIHNGGPRRAGPFVAVNCSSLPRDLAASELFGYAPGAFTGALRQGQAGKFEAANGGTIFLDEIGDMPLAIQGHLLRVLEERRITRLGGREAVRVDARVLAATNQDLEEKMHQGSFRPDLYYRLNVISIELVPLRDRLDDIAMLAEHFVQRQCLEWQRPPLAIAGETTAALLAYHWPGNVRELHNAMVRALHLCTGGAVLPEHLPAAVRRPQGSGGAPIIPAAEQALIEQYLADHGGNLSKAAQALGIARSTLYRRLGKLRQGTAPGGSAVPE